MSNNEVYDDEDGYVVDLDETRDVYAFIKGVVGAVKDKEVFSSGHLTPDIDKKLYFSIIKDVVDNKPPIKKISKLYISSQDKIYKEKIKKHPSRQKITEYKTLAIAYSDVIEFFDTYSMLQLSVYGDQSINTICSMSPENIEDING